MLDKNETNVKSLSSRKLACPNILSQVLKLFGPQFHSSYQKTLFPKFEIFGINYTKVIPLPSKKAWKAK